MTDTKKDTEETPAGYPEGWQPEEIRTIEPQPLPEDQQPPVPLTDEEATELNRLQALYPHEAVIVEYDDGKPVFVTPDGEDHKAKAPKADTKAKDDDKTESKSSSAKK